MKSSIVILTPLSQSTLDCYVKSPVVLLTPLPQSIVDHYMKSSDVNNANGDVGVNNEVNAQLKKKIWCCNWPGCQMLYKYESSLYQHQKMHKSDRKHVCSWPGCGYSSSSQTLVNRHKDIHLGKKFMCNWPNCNKSFCQ